MSTVGEKDDQPNPFLQLIGILIIVAIFYGAYSGFVDVKEKFINTESVSNNPITNIEQNIEIQNQQVKPIDPVNLVTLKSKCASDGKKYVNNYRLGQNSLAGNKPWWNVEEYHFNTKLNSCLAHIGYVRVVYDRLEGNIGDPDFISETYLTVYNFVFDIYSNQVVLQGVFDRYHAFEQENVDTLSNNPTYYQIPNLDVSEYYKQLKIIMNE